MPLTLKTSENPRGEKAQQKEGGDPRITTRTVCKAFWSGRQLLLPLFHRVDQLLCGVACQAVCVCAAAPNMAVQQIRVAGWQAGWLAAARGPAIPGRLAY